MAKNLVIVESPAKAKTIGKYLGSDYVVEASIGHIMDLPKNDIGVELKRRTFEPTLIVSPGKEKVVDRLKKLAAKSDSVFLAADPDREGEAIAAHLKMQLLPSIKDKSKLRRVTFNEITKKAVQAAFQHTRDVDENLVDAQQTRRVLDRLVGYQISPLLWDKVKRGLSAGRVQTVALRLIVEREREINAFNSVEYWNIDAVLAPEGRSPKDGGQEFTARMVAVAGQPIRVSNGTDKEGKEQFLSNALPDKAAVDEVLSQLERAKWTVRSIEKREQRRNPKAPFTTSQLQQQAAGRLGFNVRRTMGVAQRLYEGVEIGNEGTVGLITYMRTDSTNLSADAVREIREWVGKKLGDKYLPEKPNVYKSKKDAQEAHEAIRPTNVEYVPEQIRRYLSDEQYRLYKLIWERAVSSQMMPAVFDQTTVEIEAKADATYDFRTTGSILKFSGWLHFDEENKKAKAARVEAEKAAAAEEGEGAEESSDDKRLPELKEKQALACNKVDPQQKFTQPPPRFNEASLVKTLEENGIGRPSTYASIINTIQERDYVKKIQQKLVPTEIGMVVTDLLVKNFPYIFKVEYTAGLENELDAVEDGTEKWTDLLKGFYGHLEEELKVAEIEMEDVKAWEKPSDEVCEKCGAPLILKWGKFGSFYSCSNFTKAKPVTIALGPLKKTPKVSVKKVTDAFSFPVHVKVMNDDVTEMSVEVADKGSLLETLERGAEEARKVGGKLIVEPDSCDFTKENVSAKPDLTTPGADAAEQEDEACDNCGRTMVLRNGPWGPFMACPGYNEDPPCKTIRKLTQKVQSKPPVVLEEPCPKCGKPLLQRDGQYGEFIACSGYPKCKYVKQELLDVPCPKCGGEVAVRKNRRGDTFYGCTRYPKCDFTSNQKLVNQTCPKCDSAYLVEVSNAEGTFLVCPNNHEAMPKKRAKKGAEVEAPTTPACGYQKKIGPPKLKEAPVDLKRPDPEKTRPMVEAVA
ncbi:type I DNA topoisomerase [Granulicella sp. 5B5]|uniref:type I DNA topoisomerase n=1 Tax=Granulicella sp. 5B5 TaxID=1617967 RepID=UPI0015F46347|nr:type I DNA topoisomerase [Granulicella sp. 5B5]QMV18073.1 type I DNA topoisomerase [Granulicella sp. 5B5]